MKDSSNFSALLFISVLLGGVIFIVITSLLDVHFLLSYFGFLGGILGGIVGIKILNRYGRK